MVQSDFLPNLDDGTATATEYQYIPKLEANKDLAMTRKRTPDETTARMLNC